MHGTARRALCQLLDCTLTGAVLPALAVVVTRQGDFVR